MKTRHSLKTYTGSKNVVHGGYWQNFRRQTGKGEDWILYWTTFGKQEAPIKGMRAADWRTLVLKKTWIWYEYLRIWTGRPAIPRIPDTRHKQRKRQISRETVQRHADESLQYWTVLSFLFSKTLISYYLAARNDSSGRSYILGLLLMFLFFFFFLRWVNISRVDLFLLVTMLVHHFFSSNVEGIVLDNDFFACRWLDPFQRYSW